MTVEKYSDGFIKQYIGLTYRFTIVAVIWMYIGMDPLISQPIKNDGLDILNYNVTIEPDIVNERFDGSVTIDLISKNNDVVLDCGGLIIKKVQGENVDNFILENEKLIISFKAEASEKKQVNITYSGTESRGLKFFVDENQVHTAYFTQEWMICNNIPGDRATLQTNLILADNLTCFGSGFLVGKKDLSNGKVVHSWSLSIASPPYTYGFGAGVLNYDSVEYNDVVLTSYSYSQSAGELNEIFKTTADMMQFYEEKSGVPYFQKSYIQLLGIGNTSQEACGSALLRGGYGKQVLKDSTQINLSAHELAHQWWGNMITCESWNHFWLNEAMAVYMSSAYKEFRFGEEKYKEDIDVYHNEYKKVRGKNLDKPLVFDNWANPSQDDRTIVYYKGAYVLHLLRQKLGNDVFWKGIKEYSQRHYGQSVNTKEFQLAMEESANQSLRQFFDKWVY